MSPNVKAKVISPLAIAFQLNRNTLSLGNIKEGEEIKWHKSQYNTLSAFTILEIGSS